MRDEAHKRAQSGLQKKSESTSANAMCVEVEKRGGGGEGEKKHGFCSCMFCCLLICVQ